MLLTVREGMSGPKSRHPVAYPYQTPQDPLFLYARDTPAIAGCKGGGCSHSSSEEAGPCHWWGPGQWQEDAGSQGTNHTQGESKNPQAAQQ